MDNSPHNVLLPELHSRSTGAFTHITWSPSADWNCPVVLGKYFDVFWAHNSTTYHRVLNGPLSDKVKQQLIITKVRFIAVVYGHAWYHKRNCKRAFLSSELLRSKALVQFSVFTILHFADSNCWKKTKMDPFWMFIFEIIYFATPKIYHFLCYLLSYLATGDLDGVVQIWAKGVPH